MTGKPVTFVASGAPPVTHAHEAGPPVVSTTGAQPAVLTASGGKPVSVVNFPATLFLASEAGFWADVTPSRLWQDTARTTPVTAAGDPVGAWALTTATGTIYAEQATGASRPTYGVQPARGVVNTVLHSENMAQWGRTAGGVGSAPTVNVLVPNSYQTLPDGATGATAGKGFTCTGLFHESGSLYWGNLGQALPADPAGQRQIVQTNLAATEIIATVSIAEQPQGVVALGNYFYYAQPSLGQIRRIGRDGSDEIVFMADLASVNGLATDGSALFASVGTNVHKITTGGAIAQTYAVGVTVDHLCHDASRNWLWITSGANGTAGVITILHLATGAVLKTYAAVDALAIEGIAIVGDNILVASDGYYHEAEITPTARELNELQTYPLYPVVGGQISGKIADYVRFALNGGTTSSDFSQIQQNSAVAGARVGSIYMWTADGAAKNIALNIADSGGNTQEIKALTGVITRYSTARASFTGPAESIGIRLRGAAGTSDSAEVFMFAAQVEAGATVTNYQRIGSSFFDATEEGQTTLGYLQSQTDDSLATPAIDFSGTDKVTVIAGVRKLSDAAQGMVLELGIGPTAGLFHILAPPGAGSPRYHFRSAGSTASDVQTPATFAAPNTAVVTGLGDIAGDSAIVRVNGTQEASAAADQGTGNFSNAIVYIGRRGGSTLPFNGRIYGLIVRGALTSGATLTNAEAWMNARTGAY
jgi:hypothetical protein